MCVRACVSNDEQFIFSVLLDTGRKLHMNYKQNVTSINFIRTKLYVVKTLEPINTVVNLDNSEFHDLNMIY